MSTFGVVLMVVGAALMVAEAHVPTHGLLATAATAALVTGLVLALSGAGVPVAAVVSVGLVTALAGLALAAVIVRASLAVRRRSIRSGPRALIGRIGTVRAVPDPLGQVLVDGALWRARLWALEEDGPVAEGDAVVVDRVDGLTLTVRPAEEWEMLP
ncbi:MAG TPA: NfeD family protein [Solirubrobacteraceae bacterium]|jgi:membrane-bound serine protease (ClpP class)|nr:NfeD family protein [Solirubrobacteraceae bacterium]